MNNFFDQWLHGDWEVFLDDPDSGKSQKLGSCHSVKFFIENEMYEITDPMTGKCVFRDIKSREINAVLRGEASRSSLIPSGQCGLRPELRLTSENWPTPDFVLRRCDSSPVKLTITTDGYEAHFSGLDVDCIQKHPLIN